MLHNTLVVKYFFRSSHVGSVPEGSSWCTARLATASAGEDISWGMQFESDCVLKVRYLVKGPVLCVACCALAAEYCEGKSFDELSKGLSHHLIQTFGIPKEKHHVPALVSQVVALAWKQRKFAAYS